MHLLSWFRFRFGLWFHVGFLFGVGSIECRVVAMGVVGSWVGGDGGEGG